MTDWLSELNDEPSDQSAIVNVDPVSVAHHRFKLLAKELDHPLDDLLDWYQKPDDMITLGSISMTETRKAVTFYVKNLDINRYEGYAPVGYKPPPPTEKAWVMCMDCQHFTRGTVGGGGIGDCGHGFSPNPPCYPGGQRLCKEFKKV